MTAGPLALVGGNEFQPGNEAADRRLIAAAGDGPAYVVPTAAARQAPDRAVATARRWFDSLGLAVESLPVLKRRDASSAALAERARTGRFFYLVGGDPGLVVDVLADSPVWNAIVDAWRDGAALAGSSAGAMALGQWSLLRERWPNHARRRFASGLGIAPTLAVVPHFNAGGASWTADPPDEHALLVGVDERTAAVWEDGVWTTRGPGRVVVAPGGENAATFRSDESVRGLPPPLVASPHPPPGDRRDG